MSDHESAAPESRFPSAEQEGRNRLAGEKSPYLLQHADNPVDWYPWGEEAFERARREDRPIFLSIGYSTCHWCHVMEEESFEDPEVAELLNETAVPVKVDREERPDVDGFFMSVCQAMTGRGGWPLNVFLTPEGEPFFAGTYIPKESRRGRLGLLQLLDRVGELWEDERERVTGSGREIVEALQRREERRPGDELPAEVLEDAYGQLSARFDASMGGFGRAPKFPSPHNLLLLLRHWDRTGEERALEMVTTTLRRMRMGGIRDHLGGGFHRYSTDARWLLPHFEKMLYDQATLALAYTEAWQATGEDAFAEQVEEIVRYVERDLGAPEGGFFSAEDADSEGGEGAFYVWTADELRDLLDEEEYELVRRVYGVREAGNYKEEATGERTGENILHLERPVDDVLNEVAEEREEAPAAPRDRLASARRTLLAAREERPRPGLDDKVLTDWNGLMIGALARAGAAMDRPAMVDRARRAAAFVLGTLRENGGGGRLLHRYRDGEAAVPAQAADYAFLVFGLLELYEACFEIRWLEEAVRLEEEARERCWDGADGGYFVTGEDATELPVRQKEARDGALPSANSVALWNLRRLGRMTGDAAYGERAAELERAFSEQVRESPAAHTQMLVGLDFRVGPGHEVVLAGGGDAAWRRMLEHLRRPFRPRTVVLRRPADEEGIERLASLAPFTREQRPAGPGTTTAYVCRDFACEAPTTDPEEMRRQLDG